MASINGICVKGIKEFTGHEGEPLYQGNLYLGGKKIAFYSQDSWGGPDSFTFEKGFSEALLDEKVKKLNPEKALHGKNYKGEPYVMEYDLTLLLNDFIILRNDEAAYKRAVKAGFAGILLLTDGYHTTTWKLPKQYTEMSDETLLRVMEPDIAKEKKSFFQNVEHTLKIYRTFDDFNIGEPINLSDIKTKN